MTLMLGDCVELMATLEEGAVDAIVTDPPYGLEFMGKAWDAPWRSGGEVSIGRLTTSPDWNGRERPRQGSAYARSIHKRCRTCGRQEFSGTPCACPTPDWQTIASAPTQLRAVQAWHQQWAAAAFRIAKPGAYLLAFGGTRTYHRLAVAIEDAGWIIRDCLVWAYASGFPKSRALLKPAWEPIVMARKPGPLRELAIDACRIPSGDEAIATHHMTGRGVAMQGNADESWAKPYQPGDSRVEVTLGRWPANVILTDPIFDGDVEGVVGGGESVGPGVWTQAASIYGTGMEREAGSYTTGDSGTYSRFFLIPKADRADREPVLRGSLTPVDVPNYQPTVLVCQCGERWKPPENGGLLRCNHPREMYHYEAAPRDPQPRENAHPTVKPTELMRHLVRLVTPQGGTVLDPFAGSGSTLIAAEQEGFPWIGMERELEYVAIAEARLNGTQRGLGLAMP